MPVIPKKTPVQRQKLEIWAFRKEVESLSEKKSLLLYYDYQQHFNFLTDEQLGRLIRAMFDYEINRVVPEFDEPVMKMCFSFVQSNLDRDLQKYIDKCEKNAENGKKGGRPPKNQSDEQNDEQTDTTDEQREQTNTANAEYSQSQDNETVKRKAEFYSKVKEYEEKNNRK